MGTVESEFFQKEWESCLSPETATQSYNLVSFFSSVVQETTKRHNDGAIINHEIKGWVLTMEIQETVYCISTQIQDEYAELLLSSGPQPAIVQIDGKYFELQLTFSESDFLMNEEWKRFQRDMQCVNRARNEAEDRRYEPLAVEIQEILKKFTERKITVIHPEPHTLRSASPIEDCLAIMSDPECLSHNVGLYAFKKITNIESTVIHDLNGSPRQEIKKTITHIPDISTVQAVAHHNNTQPYEPKFKNQNAA